VDILTRTRSSRYRGTATPIPVLLALLICSSPTSTSAQVFAGTFYSSFGANASEIYPPSAFAANYWCITGALSTACGAAQLRQIAAPFKPTQSAPIESISLALSAGASGIGSAIVSLAQDSSGVPGNTLESWSVTNLPVGSQPALTVLNDRLNLVLTAGQAYWVVAQPMAANSDVLWYTNVLGFNGAMSNSGSGWQTLTGIVATQPAFSVAMSRTGSLSHIASGGGWTTVISLANASSAQIQVQVNLYADDGTPLNLAVTTTLAGNTQTFTAQQVSENLNPNTTLEITTGGTTGSVTVGSAQVYSTGPVTGYAIFRQTVPSGSTSEGTVPLQTQGAYSLSLPYDDTSGFIMGVALANLSPTPQTVTVAIFDQNGDSLGTQSLSIPANGHTSFVLPTQFPVTGGELGVLQFTGNGGLSGLGLRFSPFGTFTSVPATVTGPAQ